MKCESSYRFLLGIKRELTLGTVAIGVTLNSGVENCSRFELPPPLRFRIGVVVTSVVFFFMIFNSMRSFVLDVISSAIAIDVVDVDGTAFTPQFVLIAIVFFYVFNTDISI